MPLLTGYQCHLCPYMFPAKEGLAKHLSTCEISLFVCSVCGKRFLQRSGLQSHLQSHKNRKVNIACPHCHKNFKGEHNLMVHVSHYHPEKAMRRRRAIFVHRRITKPALPPDGFFLPRGVQKVGNVFHCSTPPRTASIPMVEVREDEKKLLAKRKEVFVPPTFPVRCETVSDRLPDIADYFNTE